MNFRVVDKKSGPNRIAPHPQCCGDPTALCRLCALTLLGLDPLTLDRLSGRAVANSEMVPAEDGSDADEFQPMPRLDYRANSAFGAKSPTGASRPAIADDVDPEELPMPKLSDWYAERAKR